MKIRPRGVGEEERDIGSVSLKWVTCIATARPSENHWENTQEHVYSGTLVKESTLIMILSDGDGGRCRHRHFETCFRLCTQVTPGKRIFARA